MPTRSISFNTPTAAAPFAPPPPSTSPIFGRLTGAFAVCWAMLFSPQDIIIRNTKNTFFIRAKVMFF